MKRSSSIQFLPEKNIKSPVASPTPKQNPCQSIANAVASRWKDWATGPFSALTMGLAQFRGENGGFVSVELSKDYHGDG
jgi:hypothetical protein